MKTYEIFLIQKTVACGHWFNIRCVDSGNGVNCVDGILMLAGEDTIARYLLNLQGALTRKGVPLRLVAR